VKHGVHFVCNLERRAIARPALSEELLSLVQLLFGSSGWHKTAPIAYISTEMGNEKARDMICTATRDQFAANEAPKWVLL
jgi:hypothetical protein